MRLFFQPFLISPVRLVPGLCALAGLALLAACAPAGWPFSPALTGKHPGGTPRYHVEVDREGRKHGRERWWHENGQLQSEARWVQGRRDGVYRAWYPDGTPWYAGRDSLGIPVDTVRVWHRNGRLQSLSLHRGGEPGHVETWDSAGRTPAEQARLQAEEAARVEARRQSDSLETLRTARAAALADWVPRVRATVDTYWKLSESMKKTPRRAVARLRVSPHGALLEVTWIEKSGSTEFDRSAAQALAKIRKFPPPPPDLGREPLNLHYEFTTAGTGTARRRLQLRNPEGDGPMNNGQSTMGNGQ